MNHCRQFLVTLAAAAATLAAAPCAAQSAYLYQPASAAGSYFTDQGVVVNTNFGQIFPTSDGSNFQFVTCVGSEPGQPGCAVPGGPPPPPTTWYEWPNLPSSAAAQAHTPDYGITRARAWSSGTSGVGTGAPGYTVYGAAANAGWHDEITTTSTVPIIITFVVTLHGNWNDGGVFVYLMGRPGEYDPDVGGSTPMEGMTWTNCTNCGSFGFDTGPDRTLLPGGDNGSVDQIVTLNFTVYPASFGDPEDPNPFTNPFEAMLSAYASYNDSEVDAFSTATLQAILVPPNAGLSFASGHAYNVQVVPEPATWALWAMGLAGVALAKRGRWQHGSKRSNTMQPCRHLLATMIAAAAAFGACQSAFAAPGLYGSVDARGRYYSDDNVLTNTNFGQGFPTGDASGYRFVTCVGMDPGMPGCAVPSPPPPPGAWYDLPALPSSAAAQVFTPDYGINRVRTWSRGTNGVGTGDPGYTVYTSFANSGWREEITTTSAVPVVITFVVALHVDWNDGGKWAFQMGRPGSYDPDAGFAYMDGHTWSNCIAEAVSGECGFEYYTGSELTVVPGGANGSVDFIVTQSFTVYPESFGDPENPIPFTNPFEAILGARSYANDAEVLGYSTASLQAILVPPNAGLSFASGHAYNVQVVPEPSTYALWALGLAGVALARRQA